MQVRNDSRFQCLLNVFMRYLCLGVYVCTWEPRESSFYKNNQFDLPLFNLFVFCLEALRVVIERIRRANAAASTTTPAQMPSPPSRSTYFFSLANSSLNGLPQGDSVLPKSRSSTTDSSYQDLLASGDPALMDGLATTAGTTNKSVLGLEIP